MKVKVCGLREKRNIEDIASLNPDYMGFIFYTSSPRFAGLSISSEILRALPSNITRVGVFVDEEASEVLKITGSLGINHVQLHGRETPKYCEDLKTAGLTLIKAFFISASEDFKSLHAYSQVCDYFLFDNRGRHGGGSGNKFDWDILNSYDLDKPFFLSGGIGPYDLENIAALKNSLLYAVDINSKFETSPGVKDTSAVSTFINKIKNF